MKLSELGEFKLIQEHVLGVLGRKGGLGDDCGWMDLGEDRHLIVSTDAMVEDHHYRKRWMNGEELARKAFRAAVSDISAMGGGSSLSCVVSLGLPKGTALERHQQFMAGLKKETKKYEAAILGGDMVESEKEFVSVTVFGLTEMKRALKRSQAKPGETIWLTGPAGLAAAGLEALDKGQEKKFSSLALCHKAPPVLLREASLLSHRNLSRCAIDLSDSLAASLLWIARSNPKIDLEVNLRQMPVPQALDQWARINRKHLGDYLLYGGEDYQLLFTSWCSPRVVLRYLPKAIPIGRVSAGSGKVTVVGLSGEEIEVTEKNTGHQAFKR